MRPDMIEIEQAAGPTQEVRALIAGLEAALSAEYPPEQRHGLPLSAIFQPHIRFFVARLGGEAAGCGGVALLDGYAEVKRMFVREQARGRGVAQALLARIEGQTRAAAIAVLRLETGLRQAAAVRLYQRAGFTVRDAFGDYAAMPAKAVDTSVFMEKHLD